MHIGDLVYVQFDDECGSVGIGKIVSVKDDGYFSINFSKVSGGDLVPSTMDVSKSEIVSRLKFVGKNGSYSGYEILENYDEPVNVSKSTKYASLIWEKGSVTRSSDIKDLDKCL